MCGFVAHVGHSCDEKRLEHALSLLTHRGPDGLGTWSDGNAWLGHRRLKIIDLSDVANQPMSNEDGQVVAVFNGEIYNFPDLRAELEAKGHRFRSQSDTEVIVHGYEEYGDAIVDRLWGMFAFAVWDTRKRRMFLARDRFGVKPLNYILSDGQFAAASEIPALLATGLSDRKVDVASLDFFWSLGYIPAPLSGFTDVVKLPAGHAMVVEEGRARTWRYYPPPEVAPFRGTFDEACDRFEELLTDAVRRRLVSDVPLGVTLSGGLDSAAVTVFAGRSRPGGRLVTLTVRPVGDDCDLDEGPYANLTAKRLGTEHHEIRVDPDFRESFERVTQQLGEPFAVASAIPCYYLFQALKQHATVIISGDGGDENLGGYGWYAYAGAVARLGRYTPRWADQALYGLLNAVYGRMPAGRTRLKRGLAYLQVATGQVATDSDWEHRRVLHDGFNDRRRRRRVVGEFRQKLEGVFAETDPVRRAMLTSQFDSMSYHILTKVDITSMAHAVEVRSPFLDHRLAEFARGLPREFLFEKRRGKRILRAVLRDEIPAAVLEKPKTGFGLPIRELFAGRLRGYLKEVLTAPHPVYDRLVRRPNIEAVLDAHRNGQPYLTTLLLKLLALRLWLEQARVAG